MYVWKISFQCPWFSRQALAVLGSCPQLARMSPILHSLPMSLPLVIFLDPPVLPHFICWVCDASPCHPIWCYKPVLQFTFFRAGQELIRICWNREVSCRTVPTAQQHAAAYFSCALATPGVPRDLQESSRPSLVPSFGWKCRGKAEVH